MLGPLCRPLPGCSQQLPPAPWQPGHPPLPYQPGVPIACCAAGGQQYRQGGGVRVAVTGSTTSRISIAQVVLIATSCFLDKHTPACPRHTIPRACVAGCSVCWVAVVLLQASHLLQQTQHASPNTLTAPGSMCHPPELQVAQQQRQHAAHNVCHSSKEQQHMDLFQGGSSDGRRVARTVPALGVGLLRPRRTNRAV